MGKKGLEKKQSMLNRQLLQATLLIYKITRQSCVSLRWSFETIQTGWTGRHLLKTGDKIRTYTITLFLGGEYVQL